MPVYLVQINIRCCMQLPNSDYSPQWVFLRFKFLDVYSSVLAIIPTIFFAMFGPGLQRE
jgi:hypothetical protein